MKQAKRISLLLLFTLWLAAPAVIPLAAQNINKTVTLSLKKANVKDFFAEMKKQTGLDFICSSELVNKLPAVTVNAKGVDAGRVLDNVIAQLGCKYTVNGSIVTITDNRQIAKKRLMSGTVRDENGETLPGALIRVKGTTLQVYTDADGNYQLEVPTSECELEITYLGMNTQTIALAKGGDALKRHVRMDSDNRLNEVVVTGYQTISKERATGAYSIVTSKELEKRHATNLSQALDGLMAGMQGNNDGRGGKRFTIRGTGTLLADVTPLIVVDGFPIIDNPSSAADTNPNLNALERLNTEDIESITLLKDAAAASIWGARSANGVIVITTKKGNRNNKWTVEAGTQFTVETKPDVQQLTNLATSEQTINYMRWMYENNMISTPFTPSIDNLYRPVTQADLLMHQGYLTGTLSKDEMNAQLSRLASMDNRQQIKDYLLKSVLRNQTNAAVSGGIGKWRTRVSLEYNYDSGSFVGSNDNSWKIDWKNEYELNKYLSVTAGVNLVHSNRHASLVNVSAISELAPYEILLNDDESYASNSHNSYNSYILQNLFDWSGFTYHDMNYNLLQDARTRRSRTVNTQMRTQLGLQVNIVDGLRFNSKFQYETSYYQQKDVNGEESFYTRYNVNYYTPADYDGNAQGPSAIPAGDIVINRKGKNRSALFRNDFTFDRVFGEKHAVNAVAGNEISNYYYQSWTNPYLYGVKGNNPGAPGKTGYFPTMDGSESTMNGVPANGKEYVYTSWNHNRFVSFYGNVSYMYDDRYGISASARSDASNLITSEPKYRWSPLWSVGAMWNMANEHWLKDSNAINRLTLRLTYGKNGNAATSSSARTTISTSASSVDESTGMYPGSIHDYGNPTLRWEKTAITNFGIDFSLFNNHLYGSIDYYNKKSTDVLGNVAIASVNGTSYATFNNAELTNNGVEVTLGAMGTTGDFTVSGNLTYAYNKNKVTKLYTEGNTVSEMMNSYYVPGYAISPIFTFNYSGLMNGIPSFSDVNGNQYSITDFGVYYMNWQDMLHYQGTTVAPHTAGLNLSVQWKNLSLSAYFNGRFGGKVLMPKFGYNVYDVWYGKTSITQQVTDVMDALGKPISNPERDMPLPTVDDEGNPVDVQSYGIYSMYTRSINTSVEDASYIYFNEINIDYVVPHSLLGSGWIKGMSIFGKIENLGLIWSANSKHYHPEYLPGMYKPTLSFTLGANIKI